MKTSLAKIDENWHLRLSLVLIDSPEICILRTLFPLIYHSNWFSRIQICAYRFLVKFLVVSKYVLNRFLIKFLVVCIY